MTDSAVAATRCQTGLQGSVTLTEIVLVVANTGVVAEIGIVCVMTAWTTG